MPEVGGYEKEVKKLYNLGTKRYNDESLPYSVVRDAWKGTLQMDDQRVSYYEVPAGTQLKILFLRAWSRHSGGATIKIVQTNPVSGNTYPQVGSAPAGDVDYIRLTGATSEVIGPVPLTSPIHVLEGSVSFIIDDPDTATAGTDEFGFVWWGVVEEKV